MAYKQYNRRLKEALLLLGEKGTVVPKQAKKTKKDSFGWKPKSSQVGKLCSLIVGRFPELVDPEKSGYTSLRDLEGLMVRLTKLTE